MYENAKAFEKKILNIVFVSNYPRFLRLTESNVVVINEKLPFRLKNIFKS
jgi:hypothetical protein